MVQKHQKDWWWRSRLRPVGAWQRESPSIQTLWDPFVPNTTLWRQPSATAATRLESACAALNPPRREYSTKASLHHGAAMMPPTASQKRPAMVSRWLRVKGVCWASIPRVFWHVSRRGIAAVRRLRTALRQLCTQVMIEGGRAYLGAHIERQSIRVPTGTFHMQETRESAFSLSSTPFNEVDIDFRVSGLPHAVVKQAENSRVHEFVKLIENTLIDKLFKTIYNKIMPTTQ